MTAHSRRGREVGVGEAAWPRVLVTGATGFLGGRVARDLAARGAEVVGSGRNVEAGARLERDGVQFVGAELGDAAAVAEAARGVGLVVHCGALAAPWGPEAAFIRANVDGTWHVAAACRAEGAALVHVSTPSVYADGTDRLGLTEASAWAAHPANAYAQTKGEAERVVQRFVATGLQAVILRPRALVGAGDTTLLPRLLRAAARGPLPLIGGGRALIDTTVVDNAADACRLAACALLDGRVASGRAYNVSDGTPRPFAELVSLLAEVLGRPLPTRPVPFGVALVAATALEAAARLGLSGEPLLTRYSVGVLGRSVTLDSTRARRELGWAPRVSLEHALTAFVAERPAAP